MDGADDAPGGLIPTATHQVVMWWWCSKEDGPAGYQLLDFESVLIDLIGKRSLLCRSTSLPHVLVHH